MSISNDTQRLLRRSKDSERALGRFLMAHDGPDRWLTPGNGLASSTGRVGHITGLQYDVASRSYAAENKNVKVNSQWLGWWIKIIQRAMANSKEPLLVIDPSNKPSSFVYNGFKYKIPKMHILTEERHAHLLACERAVEAAGIPPADKL